jgi:hypothetical protein
MTAPRVRALCCECGNLRTVSSRHAGACGDPDRSSDDGLHPLGWRMTITLNCGHCGRLTRHAKLRDGDPYRDSMEERQTLGWVPGEATGL